MSEPVPAGPPKTLAEALTALQAQLPHVAKTADAQYGKYADLTMVSEALLPLLASLGLSWTCCPTMDGDRFVLSYVLEHEHGGDRHGQYPLPTAGSPQQIGSAITYARRYALCAVTGLAPGGDDDDAQAAEAVHRKPRTVPDAQLAAEGRMTRAEKSAHERLAADTVASGRAGRSHPRGPDPDDPWAQDAPVDGQRAAAMRQSVTEPEAVPGSSNGKQWQLIAILYGQIGYEDREMKLADLTDRTGREITSAKDLSYAEAEQVIRDLRPLAETAQEVDV